MNNEDFKEIVLPSWVKKLLGIVGFFCIWLFYEEFYETEEFIARVRLHKLLNNKSFRDFEFVETGYDDVHRIKINSDYNITVWEDGHFSVHLIGSDSKCIMVPPISSFYAKKIYKESAMMINEMIKERNIELCLPNYQSLKKSM